MLVAMTHGSFLSVAATLTIMAAVVVLAGLSSLALLKEGNPGAAGGRFVLGCLALTGVVAVLAVFAIRPGGPW